MSNLVNATPKFTSDTVSDMPGSTVIVPSDLATGTTWSVFDGNTATAIRSATTPILPNYIGLNLPTKKFIKKYSLLLNDSGYLGMTDWEFQGSNDNFTTYDVLHIVAGKPAVGSPTLFEYDLPNVTKKYKSFRIKVNGRIGANSWGLIEFKIYELIFEHKFLISSEDATYSLHKKLKPLIPVMNGYENAVGSVIGSGSYLTNYTWKAFDNDDATYYGTSFVPASSYPVYVGFRFNDPVCVKRYSFLAGLRTFKFMASNNGTTWDTLDTRTSLESNTTTTQTFDIQNNNFYTHYKIQATLATTGSDWISIFSAQFYELPPTVLITCTANENNFVNHGMERGFNIDTSEQLNTIKHIRQNSTSLGSGKVFKQKIDTTKRPIKKVSIT
ncbi:hypothetical protein [Paenibacillus tuaregi]|uniref:hypothetical protein n=1 Tax=Paenibacillus tuaregi TaxID=1816681 RepID=UPI0008385943|nr:hypothetical protein [Paenibacillus tuaregi]